MYYRSRRNQDSYQLQKLDQHTELEFQDSMCDHIQPRQNS